MTYTTVKDHIVQFVQKTYKNGQDVAISLRNLQKMDLTGERPRRGEATSPDANEARMEQSGLDSFTKPRSRGSSRELKHWTKT